MRGTGGCGGDESLADGAGGAMSLINQMLQDLDARRATHGTGARLPNDVRPLPVAEPSRLPIILGFTLLLVLVAGFSFYWWEMRPLAFASPAAVVAVQPAPPAAKVSEAEKVVSPEAVRVDAAPAESLVLPELEGSLRMADFLKPPVDGQDAARSATVAGVTEKPLPAKNKGGAERTTIEAKVLPIPLEPSERPVKPPRIERSESVGTPHERAESGYRKAIAAVNQGRVSEAIDGLHVALQQDGLHSASRQLLIRLLLEAKRPDEAVKVLQEGLLAQPAQINWAMSLARMQVERGDLAGAWQTLDHSMPAAVRSADYQGFSAHVLHRLGRSREAVAYYQAATRLSPEDGRWWLGLGLVLEAEGHSGEARQAFLRARQSGTLRNELAALVEQKLR